MVLPSKLRRRTTIRIHHDLDIGPARFIVSRSQARCAPEAERMQCTMESPKEIENLDLRLDLTQALAFRAGKPVPLTGSEFRLLAALLSEPGRVFSRQELIRAALGE